MPPINIEEGGAAVVPPGTGGGTATAPTERTEPMGRAGMDGMAGPVATDSGGMAYTGETARPVVPENKRAAAEEKGTAAPEGKA